MQTCICNRVIRLRKTEMGIVSGSRVGRRASVKRRRWGGRASVKRRNGLKESRQIKKKEWQKGEVGN